MKIEQIIHAHDLVDQEHLEETRIEAANYILACTGAQQEKCRTHTDALLVLNQTLHWLLNTNQYSSAAILLWGTLLFDPRPYFVRQVWRCLREFTKLLIMGCAAGGKCLARGTGVLMHDGSVVPVEDIEVGDVVMGDDSKPRHVLSLARGRSKMFRVVPKIGQPWTCTADHILTLRCGFNHPNGDRKTISSTYRKGRIIDIPAQEFATKSKTFRSHFSQFITGVEFPSLATQFDPYIYGLWLGDGGVGNAVLHNHDQMIIKTWCDYFTGLGYRIAINTQARSECAGYFARWFNYGPGRTSHDKEQSRLARRAAEQRYRDRRRGKTPAPFTDRLHNPFRQFIRSSFINGEKRILRAFLINGRSARLKLLAGIIDTDGWAHDCGYCITTKYRGLADDLEFLARSLGYFTTTRPMTKRIRSIGFVGQYFNVWISGPAGTMSAIPTLLKKPTRNGASRKDPTLRRIRLEPLLMDDYFGFTTDGNQRFLLGDFTVTHNSYNVMAHDLLDWIRDPWNTTIKIISTTAGHARAQTFSLLVRFHRESIIPLPGYIRQGYIGMDKDDRRASISELAIDKGSELEGKSGKLQGFHPLPRSKPHPIFGRLTRVRARLDEAEDIPPNVWPGIANLLKTADDIGSVAVAGMFNPKRRDSAVAQRCEPIGGWGNFNIEKDEEWMSKQGFHVLRLDGKKCENVVEKKVIYPGLITYEGYMEHGVDSPEHYTFGRGAYPVQSAAYNIVSQADLDYWRGSWIWARSPHNLGSFDTALEEGGDAAMYTGARYGEAIGFIPEGKPPIRFDVSRWAIQIEQQFPLEKKRTLQMAKDLISINRRLHVKPEWFCMDRTGNGAGLCDTLYENFGEILGIQWGEGATEVSILEEDTEKAEDLYANLVTEMLFAFGRWLEFGYIAISPGFDASRLITQAAARKYKRISKTLVQAESKKEYKKRLSAESPDECDSAIQIVHLVRMRAPRIQVHAMEPAKAIIKREGDYLRHGQLRTITTQSAIDKMERVELDQ